MMLLNISWDYLISDAVNHLRASVQYDYGLGDPFKVPFTMSFPPSCREILRENILYLHLIRKLCRFHGCKKNNKKARCGCGAFMQVKLSSKSG